MSDSENESVCTYYSSCEESQRSINDEEEFVEEYPFDYYSDEEYYDEEIAPKDKIENIVPKPVINTAIPSVCPWKKQEAVSSKSFLDILKEEEEISKLEKIQKKKDEEFAKKYKNRPNFNFSNTFNHRTKISNSSRNLAGENRVSLLKTMKNNKKMSVTGRS